jgi:hypothetical protein
VAKTSALAVAGALLLTAVGSFAQDAPSSPGAVEGGRATETETETETESESESESDIKSSAAADRSARCVLGEHLGVEEAHARTAAVLICDALREEGARVASTLVEAAQAPGLPAYRIELRPIGSLLVVRLSRETPLGTEIDSRSLRLQSIDELPVAAPRLARALHAGAPVEETAGMKSLVGDETRTYRKKSGETLFAVGVHGHSLLGAPVTAGYGVYARLYYETPAYSVGASARVGGSSSADGDGHLYGVSVNARAFFSDADIGPFVGGGVGILWLGWDEPGSSSGETYETWDDREYSGGGLAPYLEAGVELMRHHGGRLEILARLDVPVFEAEAGSDGAYAVPLSLMAAYSFD